MVRHEPQPAEEVAANLVKVEVMAASNEPMSVAEVFVPGRFADECARVGFESKGIYDLSNGWDWRVPLARREAQQSILETEPDLVASAAELNTQCPATRPGSIFSRG